MMRNGSTARLKADAARIGYLDPMGRRLLTTAEEVAALKVTTTAASDAFVEVAETILFDIEAIRDQAIPDAVRRVLASIERQLGHLVGLPDEIALEFQD